MIITFKIRVLLVLITGAQGEEEWRSGKSTRLLPMWPGFESFRRRHMWVEFVVDSLLCSERFFSGYSGFPLSSKTNTSKFQSDLERTDTFKQVLRTPKCFLGKKKIYNIFLYIILHLSHEKIVLFGSTFLMLYFSWSTGANFLVYIL